MPDISMCADADCPFAVRCYRSPKSDTKPSDFRQAWFLESPRRGDSCDMFWDKDQYFRRRGEDELASS